jgi:hypothetical protein
MLSWGYITDDPVDPVGTPGRRCVACAQECQACSCCCVIDAAFPTQLAYTCAPTTVCPISNSLYFAMQTILGTWPPLHIELAAVTGDHTLLGAYPSDGIGPDGLPLPFNLTTPTSLDQGPTVKIGQSCPGLV